MEYIKSGQSGIVYKVKINRGTDYTKLTVENLNTDTLVYHSQYLPLLGTQIEAEDNAERIADQYIR